MSLWAYETVSGRAVSTSHCKISENQVNQDSVCDFSGQGDMLFRAKGKIKADKVARVVEFNVGFKRKWRCCIENCVGR